ncbi:MAG: hypothetical protein ABSH30_16815, partial [Acidimicrobiales bacterium]
VTIAGGSTIEDTGAAGSLTVTSTGSLTMSSSGGTANIHVPYDLSGPVDVTAGTLSLGGDSGTLGHFSVASGATLNLAPGSSYEATIAAGTSNSGAGTLEITGGGTVAEDAPLDVANLTIDGSTTTADDGSAMAGELLIEGGEYDPVGSSTFSVGSFSLAGGQLGDETNTVDGITDDGTFSWSSGSFYAPTAESPQPPSRSPAVPPSRTPALPGRSR